MNTQNNTSKFFVALLFIFLTIAIAVSSLLPAFTVDTREMSSKEASSYTNGYLTKGMVYDEEISVGLMPIISALPNIKHLIFVIYFQEIHASLENDYANALMSGRLEDAQRARDKATKHITEYENYEGKEELDALLRDEEFLDGIQLYYAMRYLTLSYFTDDLQDIADISSDSDRLEDARGLYAIILLVITFLAFAATVIIIGALIARLLLLLFISLKNLFGLGSYMKKCPEKMPEKVIPGRCLTTAIAALFIFKMLYGEMIVIGLGSYIAFIAPMGFHFIHGFYKLIAEGAGSAKNWLRWVLRIVTVALVVLTVFTLTGTKLTSFSDFKANGNFKTVIDALESYNTKLILELVLKLFGLLCLFGFSMGLAYSASGSKIKAAEGKFETVFANESSVVVTIILLATVLPHYFLIPGQSIISPILIIAAICLNIFSSKIPAILSDPDPKPMQTP